MLVLPDEATEYARQVVRRYIEYILYAGVVTRGFGTTIPIEMYDPFEGRWMLNPQPPRTCYAASASWQAAGSPSRQTPIL